VPLSVEQHLISQVKPLHTSLELVNDAERCLLFAARTFHIHCKVLLFCGIIFRRLGCSGNGLLVANDDVADQILLVALWDHPQWKNL